MFALNSVNLPSGQKHPSTQWSSHNWLLSRLLQVSEQGLPHSWYSMLKGQVFAVKQTHAQIVTQISYSDTEQTGVNASLEHILIFCVHFSPHSCWVFHSCGCPPAWAHWRENSDTVGHRHVVLSSQWQRSSVQALMKASVSTRSWQLAKAGPNSKFSHTSPCGSACRINLNWVILITHKGFSEVIPVHTPWFLHIDKLYLTFHHMHQNYLFSMALHMFQSLYIQPRPPRERETERGN